MTNTINENNKCCEDNSCCCENTAEEKDTKACCCADNETEEEGCCCGHEHHHHDHDHEHDHEYTPVVTFENEDGTTEEYPIVDEFEFEGNVYVLVMNDDESVTPLRVEGEDGELVFLGEDEFEKVSEAYAALEDSEELQ